LKKNREGSLGKDSVGHGNVSKRRSTRGTNAKFGTAGVDR